MNVPPSIDILKQQKQRIENEMDTSQQLKARVETLENNLRAITSTYGKMMLKPISGYNNAEYIEFPGYNPDEVIQKYNQMKEITSQMITKAKSKGVSQEKITEYEKYIAKLLS